LIKYSDLEGLDKSDYCQKIWLVDVKMRVISLS